MAVGIGLGIALPAFAVKLAPVSNIFIRLIRSIIAPLIFGTLVYGIAGTGDIKRMGRIGLKAIIYFEVVTTIALFLGLGAVNLTRPGAGVKLEHAAADAVAGLPQPSAGAATDHVLPSSIIHSIPPRHVLEPAQFSY